MALDMRALYYIVLQNAANGSSDVQREEENAKANENSLNQNLPFWHRSSVSLRSG